MIAKYRLELIKEYNVEYDFTNKKLRSPNDTYIIALEMFRLEYQAEEIFGIITVDTKNNATGAFEVSRGSINSSIVHPREVFKRALLNNASSIFLIHNHPSGEVEPSPEDIILTNRLVEASKILGINILDHLIIGDETYYSFKKENLL